MTKEDFAFWEKAFLALIVRGHVATSAKLWADELLAVWRAKRATVDNHVEKASGE